jgi:hypothetical protein
MRSQLLIAALAMLLSSCGGTRHVGQFYREQKTNAEGFRFSVPGWLIWFGTGVAYESVNEPEVKTGLQIARKLKGIRMSSLKTRQPVRTESVATMLSGLRSSRFEDLILVKSGSANFSIMVREKNDRIRNLFIYALDGDELFLMELRSRLHYEEIRQLIRTFSKEIKADQPLKKPLPQA